jgi:hypothetical protein
MEERLDNFQIAIGPVVIVVQIAQHHKLGMSVNKVRWNDILPIGISKYGDQAHNCQSHFPLFHSASSSMRRLYLDFTGLPYRRLRHRSAPGIKQKLNGKAQTQIHPGVSRNIRFILDQPNYASALALAIRLLRKHWSNAQQLPLSEAPAPISF